MVATSVAAVVRCFHDSSYKEYSIATIADTVRTSVDGVAGSRRG